MAAQSATTVAAIVEGLSRWVNIGHGRGRIADLAALARCGACELRTSAAALHL
ncbi:MAG: hypothetical protein L0K86_18250 [Actinomycetia bacterium]|nr:hypothetical protein [Actinomycetes bacterium]